MVIAAVIAVTQGVRKITVQYAKRVVGRKMYGGQTQYMPLKVNYAGVMPIIFAWALLIFPATIVGLAFKNSRDRANMIANNLSNGWLHYVVLAAMIFFFSYFWVATQFQPSQIADDLKKYGGYIPGVRPGKPTSEFLDFTMTRLTFAGAIFLTLIAILPSLLSQGLNVPTITAQFFGGTSLLIIVGVMLDTMRQVETHLIQRHYDGFLRKGRIRSGRFAGAAYNRGEAARGKHAHVALCRHCGAGDWRGRNFSLRALGEKKLSCSWARRVPERNSSGNDHTSFRDSSDLSRQQFFGGKWTSARRWDRKRKRLRRHGALVSDAIIVRLIEDWLNLHGHDGFVFDGFPRTLPQAKSLDEILKRRQSPLDLAVWLDVSEETVRDRIASRLQCRRCGFTTSVTSAGFAERPICPYCDGPLVRREDDDVAILQTRLAEFNSKTQPLAAFYEEKSALHRIDG